MKATEICKACGKGKYNFSSGLYDYYTCGHAYEKPLNEEEKGKWIRFNPYKNRRSINANPAN